MSGPSPCSLTSRGECKSNNKTGQVVLDNTFNVCRLVSHHQRVGDHGLRHVEVELGPVDGQEEGVFIIERLVRDVQFPLVATHWLRCPDARYKQILGYTQLDDTARPERGGLIHTINVRNHMTTTAHRWKMLCCST